MRRPVLYLAGFLLATGASLALAGPAQAAVSDNHHKCHGVYSGDYYDDGDYYEGGDFIYSSDDDNTFTQFGLVNVGGIGLLGTGTNVG